MEFDPSPENLSAVNVATIAANVTAKKAAVTSATISYKIEEMHDSFKFKYTRLVRRMIRKVKILQIPVIVPKEIIESSDLTAQVYFSVVKCTLVLSCNFQRSYFRENFASLFLTGLINIVC